mmetsp:Transcript_5331/g.12828  ORF Transcript_5331/g.12828 Transcript_5331/m.12828 type:complete len:967 (-) Transcript_5331:50-2950(-)
MAADGSDPMAMCVQALQALYSSPDPATKKQADDWLTKFQQTPQAWQVADQLLSQGDAPVQFRFFAAQTLRTKLQFDFYELPTDSYGSLRDALLGHIDRFQAPECQPIQTMLAIAISDMMIQMDAAWPNPIASLFERWGTQPQGYATLVEVLIRLPEENMNNKLMTDTIKRYKNKEMLRLATPTVVPFLLKLPCPSMQAKRKVLECFLSWVKFTDVPPHDLAQNPLIPECFKYVEEGTELSETATDIIIELLRMSASELNAFEPVIKVMLPLLGGLQAKFKRLMANGAQAAVDMDRDGVLQICRIHVEIGECLIPLIIQQMRSADVIAVLEVLVRCTDLPVPEISSIPLDFWQRLAHEVCRHPEQDVVVDQFKGVYTQLLGVVIQRLQMKPGEDPFTVDDDFIYYRSQILKLSEDCIEILTPNTALEQLLQSLQETQRYGVVMQEAHFCALTCVAPKAEVREHSVLWQLLQSLPPLIAQQVAEDSPEAGMLHFTKKTALELLGCLWMWVKTRPEFVRSSLEMISSILMQPVLPPGSPTHILERQKQVQQAAAIAFKSICSGGRASLQDLVDPLIQLYIQTMQLPIRMHLFIVEGVAGVISSINNADMFKSALEKLVTPLITGLSSERDKPNILGEILDRVQCIIRSIKVGDPASSKAACMGNLVGSGLLPLMKQTLSQHAADAKVVEKCCRVLKHSMRCVRDHFKPHVPELAQLLIEAFGQHQHSSYCYQAEILASEFKSDPEVQPVLTGLFHHLSRIGYQCLMAAQNQLENLTELVEDYFGMFDRFLRHVPPIILEAPTLAPTLQMWQLVIFVQQKDAIEAIVAFIEAVLEIVAEACGTKQGRFPMDHPKMQHGQLLRTHVAPVMPGFVEAVMRLIANVPTKTVQEMLPSVLEHIRDAFPQEFAMYLQNAFKVLPPSVASPSEQQKLCEQLVRGHSTTIEDAVEDLIYRCEQVALRSKEKTSAAKQ